MRIVIVFDVHGRLCVGSRADAVGQRSERELDELVVVVDRRPVWTANVNVFVDSPAAKVRLGGAEYSSDPAVVPAATTTGMVMSRRPWWAALSSTETSTVPPSSTS